MANSNTQIWRHFDNCESCVICACLVTTVVLLYACFVMRNVTNNKIYTVVVDVIPS